MKRLLLSFLVLFAAATAFGGDYQGTTGLQLYSLRDVFGKDPAAALDQIKAWGITQVETYNTPKPAPADLRKMLDERGLKAMSGHFGYDTFEKDTPQIIEAAKALGMEYAGIAWIPHVPAMFGQDTVDKAAADFNKWGEELSKHGLKFFYHCHGYEFEPIAEGETKTWMDVLMEKTNPKYVAFEMDVFWVMDPGADPAKYLEKYPGRWQLMHIKDIAKGVKLGRFLGHAAPEECVTIGTGQVDWPKVLAAAAKSGVKYYFIEDESKVPLTQIPQSVKYLETLK